MPISGSRSTASSHGSTAFKILIGVVIGYMICTGSWNPFAVLGGFFDAIGLSGLVRRFIGFVEGMLQ